MSPSQAGPIPLTYDLGLLPHPASLLHAFRDMPSPALLDGAMTDAPGNRFSYLTADPFMVIRSRGRQVTLEQGNAIEELEGDPWSTLQGLLRKYRTEQVSGLPPFQGGVLGYWSYDLGRHLERLPSWAEDDLRLPEMYLGFYDWALAYDGDTGRSCLISTGLPEGTVERAHIRAEEIMGRLKKGPQDARPSAYGSPVSLQSNFTQETYIAAIEQIKEYLAAGDTYQVNLSQRFQSPFQGDPWDLYLRLRSVNPAPFAAYLDFPDVKVLSASPEEFLHLERGQVRVRPIKGTRPAARDSQRERTLRCRATGQREGAGERM